MDKILSRGRPRQFEFLGTGGTELQHLHISKPTANISETRTSISNKADFIAYCCREMLYVGLLLADKVLIIHTDNSLFLIFEVFNANIGSL
jgi:hypothetical protein